MFKLLNEQAPTVKAQCVRINILLLRLTVLKALLLADCRRHGNLKPGLKQVQPEKIINVLICNLIRQI